MTDLLTYSTNPDSTLNEARRQLWSSRYMLEVATEEPGKYEGPKFWNTAIDRDLEELRKVAKELRARLPALKFYKMVMKGEASQFSFWEKAYTRGQAMYQATNRYPWFDLHEAEELE